MEAQAMEEILRARFWKLVATMAEALALNRQASIAIGSSSRHEDSAPTNVPSLEEIDQPPVKQVFLKIQTHNKSRYNTVGDASGNCTSKLVADQHPIGA